MPDFRQLTEFQNDLQGIPDAEQNKIIRTHLSKQVGRQEVHDDKDAAERRCAHLEFKSTLTELAAYIDKLTGLPNRKFFDEFLAKIQKERSPAAIVFLDIDNFKTFNDERGHAIGDIVLNDVGVILGRPQKGENLLARLRAPSLAALGPQATAFRYGGEEMAVVLTDVLPWEYAEAFAETTRRTIAEELDHMDVTVSIGVATFDPESGEEIVDTLQRADTAMYGAKRNGKNCVCVSLTGDKFYTVDSDMKLIPIEPPTLRGLEAEAGHKLPDQQRTAPIVQSKPGPV